MPCEDRTIVFDYTEIYKALFGLSVQEKLGRPMGGAITGMTVITGGSQSVSITFTNKLNRRSATTEYSHDFLRAALIRYCRMCRIPVPRKRARKCVELGDGSVTLRITM